jgi:hypothetical protein
VSTALLSYEEQFAHTSALTEFEFEVFVEFEEFEVANVPVHVSNEAFVGLVGEQHLVQATPITVVACTVEHVEHLRYAA